MVKSISILLFLSSLTAACGQISPYAVAFPDQEYYQLQPGELILAAMEEDIPPIQAVEEYFVHAEKADIDNLDLVVGLFIGGESRAYPVRLLSLHEVVNDQMGGIAFAVTWCPLCFSPVVFDRTVAGNVLTFQASGYLLHDNLVLRDDPTDTLWSQLLGQGIKGAQRGTVLEVLPSSLTTWEAWRESYPDSLALSAEKLGYQGEVPDPYAGYFNSSAVGLGGDANLVDQRLPGKKLVVGISLGETSKAYPLDLIKEKRIIQDRLGPYPVVLVWDEKKGFNYLYLREIDGELIDFQLTGTGEYLIDNQTGSIWNISSGTALKGDYVRETLARIPSQLAYWFAWLSFYPESGLFTSN